MNQRRTAILIGVALAAVLVVVVTQWRAADVNPAAPRATTELAQLDDAPVATSVSLTIPPRDSERTDVRAETTTTASPAAALEIRGRVVDELKRPIVFFGLRAIHRDENNWFVEKREWPVELHKDGEFDLNDLTAGRWELAPFADGLHLKHAMEFTYALDRRIDFEMSGVATIAGFVLDPAGQPVADALVTVDGDAQELRTTVGGAFEFDVAAGRHLIRAKRRGFARSEELEIHIGTRDRRGDLRLSLQHGTTLRGSLIDEDGQPLARMLVWAAADELPYPTDDAGRFTIPGLERGLVDLRVAKVGANEPMSHSVADVRDEETKDVRLTLGRKRNVHVVGTVKEREYFSLLKLSVKVAAFEDRLTAENLYKAEVDTDGRFELDLPTYGRFRFTLFSDHHAVVIDVPDRDEFEITLER